MASLQGKRFLSDEAFVPALQNPSCSLPMLMMVTGEWQLS